MKRLTLMSLLLPLVLLLSACEQVVTIEPVPTATAPRPTSAPLVRTAEATSPAAELLERALRSLRQGDDGAAAIDLSALLQRYPELPEAIPARYYLGVHYATRGRWTSAAELLRQVPPADPRYAWALFWLARAHEAAGAHAAAIETYGRYRTLGGLLEPYAALRQAAQERTLGQRRAAITNFLLAARSPLVRGERAGAFEKAIALLREDGLSTEALELYRELLDLAQQPAYRARILGEAVALAQELNQPDQARGWLVSLVEEEPLRATPQAAQAADQLLAAGDQLLSAAVAGQIYAANERWADAVAQLTLASANEPDPAVRSDLLRRQGLALRAQGNFAEALAVLATASTLLPDSESGRQAQLDRIQTVGQSGETLQAIEGYQAFAATYPDDLRAPIALDRVVQLYERLGDSEAARAARLNLGQRYPASREGRVALHQSGLALFDAGQFEAARMAWELLAAQNTGADRARGAFWAARAAQASGDPQTAEQQFMAAQEAAPTSYEGTRALELLGSSRPQGSLTFDGALDATAWAEAESWVKGWATESQPLTTTVPLSVTLERAAQLEAVGLQREAAAEWLQALEERRQPGDRLELARAAYTAGAFYPALLAAERLVRQAPAEAPPVPIALQRLRFPTPYPELISRESRERGIDPRLLYALLRQESLFNPGATSWVGARGLGQIMPTTGEGIAQNLGVTDFLLDDLYRPAVSIRFAAFYLGRRISDMEGSIHGALSAYNGGLGNAQRWAGGSRVADPDRFSELIDFPETQGYLRAVYSFWGVYRSLYRTELAEP